MMNVRALALAAVVLSVAACANDLAAPGTLPPLVGANGVPPSTALVATTAAPSTTIAAPVPTAAPTVAPAAVAPTVAPETVPAAVATSAVTTSVVATAAGPHGAAIETGCVRSNIDFAAVRSSPGVDQAQVGEIPPGTCDVVVYAIGSDGRIPWLQVAFGDVFGWSAQSNFVPTSFAPSP